MNKINYKKYVHLRINQTIPMPTQQILSPTQVAHKLQRISYQIAENNTHTNAITLIGINTNGLHIATILQQQLTTLGKNITLANATITDNKLVIDANVSLHNATVILVDDVLNTGYTMALAFAAIMDKGAKNIHLAVLVNRDHRNYCIMPNYTGVSLATTLQEHIAVQINGDEITATLS
jgi:pyrimidine operon attenuation protein/uracil phosphoribosyltransferase